jgi:hypothetical protein
MRNLLTLETIRNPQQNPKIIITSLIAVATAIFFLIEGIYIFSIIFFLFSLIIFLSYIYRINKTNQLYFEIKEINIHSDDLILDCTTSLTERQLKELQNKDNQIQKCLIVYDSKYKNLPIIKCSYCNNNSNSCRVCKGKGEYLDKDFSALKQVFILNGITSARKIKYIPYKSINPMDFVLTAWNVSHFDIQLIYYNELTNMCLESIPVDPRMENGYCVKKDDYNKLFNFMQSHIPSISIEDELKIA